MAFMIVGLHAGFLSEFTKLGEYLTVNGIFRIAVPVFLIINGFYFYPLISKNKQMDWLKRVFILYLVWMLFYSYFWLPISSISLNEITKLIKNIIIGYHHLWYISGMIGAAIILLFFHRFSSSTLLIITTIVLFLVGVFIQYLGNYHYFNGTIIDNVFNQNWAHRNAIFFAYPFFCIGYLIKKHRVYEKIPLRYAAIISAVGILFLLYESYFNYYQEGRDGGFDNYLSLLMVGPFIFITFIKINITGNSKEIALYSSAIYFIHSFILSLLTSLTEIEPTALTFIAILISGIASYFIIKINNKHGFIL